mgnify:FL=1
MSLPSRERGLKLKSLNWASNAPAVAPLAGAWIETILRRLTDDRDVVAPLAGAWIETWLFYLLDSCCFVAPLAGAWIETDSDFSI